jgi:hypothetical protein
MHLLNALVYGVSILHLYKICVYLCQVSYLYLKCFVITVIEDGYIYVHLVFITHFFLSRICEFVLGLERVLGIVFTFHVILGTCGSMSSMDTFI